VRPFVLEELVLSEIAEEEGFELTDQIAIGKFLKGRVGASLPAVGALLINFSWHM
jgi:double-strand break repair protein MRE11